MLRAGATAKPGFGGTGWKEGWRNREVQGARDMEQPEKCLGLPLVFPNSSAPMCSLCQRRAVNGLSKWFFKSSLEHMKVEEIHVCCPCRPPLEAELCPEDGSGCCTLSVCGTKLRAGTDVDLK